MWPLKQPARNFNRDSLNGEKTKENKKDQSNKDQKGTENITRNTNTMALNSYLSLIILNVNGLNVPIKRYRVSEWIKNKTKQNIYMLPTRDSF